MFLIVTEEAVVKGHFTSVWTDSQCVPGAFCVVTAQTRSVTFLRWKAVKQSVSVWTDSQCVPGAFCVVTAQTRSVTFLRWKAVKQSAGMD